MAPCIRLTTGFQGMLKTTTGFLARLSWVQAVALTFVAPAAALQVHPSPEGLYAHQLAHIFFILTMGLFAFWLKKRGLAEQPGWQCIRICCFFFILWNVGAFIGHIMDSGIARDAFIGKWWNKKLLPEAMAHPYIYYFLRLDHLFSVPAIIALYLGLRRLRKDAGDRVA